jgi:hypothetical protein
LQPDQYPDKINRPFTPDGGAAAVLTHRSDPCPPTFWRKADGIRDGRHTTTEDPVYRRNSIKEALAFCDQQDRKADLCEEMRKATQMIRAMSRSFQAHDLLRL